MKTLINKDELLNGEFIEIETPTDNQIELSHRNGRFHIWFNAKIISGTKTFGAMIKQLEKLNTKHSLSI